MRNNVILVLLVSVLTTSTMARQPAGADAAPTSAAMVVGDAERRFDFDSAKGLWVAVHVLPSIGSPEARTIIQEYMGKAATVAGVRHIFVTGEPVEAFGAALAALPGGDKAPVYRDADGQLAGRLQIAQPVTAPVLVVVDPARHELFRHTGRTPSDRLSFSAFAKRIAEATQDRDSRAANVASQLAIEGYDPVAYLDQQKAVPGDKKFESAFKGITYRFASAASRDAFNAAPVKYLPAYGGWCATAIAKGDKVEIDPKNFKVTNGRVFLFYKGFFGNALNDWNKDEAGLTVKADLNWKKLLGEK